MRGNISWRATLALSVATACFVFSAGPASAKLLVYEPFAYTDPNLTGQGGALGTTGTWTSYDSIGGKSWALHQEGVASGVVLSDGVTPSTFDGKVANLQTSGGYTGYNPGGNNLSADIGLASSVTDTFQSGTTTWISYVSVRAWNLNMEHANLVIATAPAPNGSRGDNFGGIGAGGSGFGTGGGPTRNNRTYIYPMFYSAGQYNNMKGAIPSNSYAQSAYEVPGADAFAWEAYDTNGDFGAPNIVVVKLEWNADTKGEDIISVVRFLETDTLSEANFNTLIAAQPNLSSANWAEAYKPNLDETLLDTITFMGVKYFVDEIRIATTFEEVIGISLEVTGDTNDDGVVDAADYITLKQNFGGGSGGDAAVGNFDEAGTVDWADLSILMAQMGAVSQAAAVPEPATLGLLAFGAMAVLRRNRRS